MSNTTKNDAGFVDGGHYLRYANYSSLSQPQKDTFASMSKPESGYPTSQVQETADLTAGLYNFADGGKPYVLYPRDYVESL